MRETFFRNSALFLTRHYSRVLWAVGLFFLAAAAYLVVHPPRIESDILGLLPQKNPVVKEFRSALDDFKSIDHLFILIKLKNPEESMEDYFDDIDEYVQRLKDTGMVVSVEYRIQDLEPAVKDLLPYTFLYLKPGELDSVSDALSRQAIEEAAAKNRSKLRSPLSFYEKQLIKFDPFNLLPILKSHFLGKSRRLRVDLSTGYYLSGDKDEPSLLLMVKPTEPAQEMVFGKKLMKALNDLERGFKKDFPGTSALTFSYGGGYAINQSDTNLVLKDATLNTMISTILVFLITFFAFRAKSPLVYGWLPLFSALFLTLFCLVVTGNALNSATANVGAMLIGLGVDFSTVLYGRYIQEKKGGASTEEALGTVMGHTFRGIVTGALTTIVVFLALFITPFRGMKQVGMLTAVGITLVLLMNFVLFPPMIAFHDHYKKKRGKEPKLRIHSFGIEQLSVVSYRYPVVILVLLAAITGVFGYISASISMDDSVAALRSSNNSGLVVTREINRRFGASFTYMMATVYGDTPFEIASKTKLISDSLDELRQDGRVLFTDSLSTYLPPKESQEAVIQKLAELRRSGMTYDRIESDFLSSCSANGFDPAYFKDFLGALKKMVEPDLLTYERLRESPLAPFLDKFIVRKDDGRYRGVVYIYISEEFKRNEPSGLVAAVQEACPDAQVTGMNRLSRTLRSEMKDAALRSFALGMLFVVILIYMDFKSIWLTLLSMAPFLISLVWLMGTMVLFKEPINMMNIFVATMISGIGTDYGLYIVHRYTQPGGTSHRKIIDETCKPIIIVALSTMAGFGSLYFSSFPGLKSIGLVSGFGVLYSMVMTLTFQIAVISLMERRRNRKQVK